MPTRPSRRRGSTLLVVVALMGMLSLLGVMFFVFASQEAENAKNYHEAAKIIHDPELGPDVYFDWALRQLINGPEDSEKQSALWGRHHSLLPNAYGRDAHPHTGTGLRLRNDLSTPYGSSTLNLTAFVDMDGDGIPDAMDLDGDNIQDLLELNRSPAANVYVDTNPANNLAYEFRADNFPEPDVDYTYPDINNVFLAYHTQIPILEQDVNSNGSLDPFEDINGNGVFDTDPYLVRIIKPSFFRPEILYRLEGDHNGNGSSDNEDLNGDGFWDPLTEDANGNGFFDMEDYNNNGSTSDSIARMDPTWYWGSWSRSLVLRPHPDHFYVPFDATTPPTVRRFLNDNDPMDVGIIATLPGTSKGFPFAGPRNFTSGDTQPLAEGLWRGYLQMPDPSTATPPLPQYQFDVDADNDGIKEAILLDLAFPVQERPSDGALYVPIFAVTLYDADGLINLNAAGNLAGDTTAPTATLPFGDGSGALFAAGISGGPLSSISRSLHGISPYEVNPIWAMDRDPNDPDPSLPLISSDFASYFGQAPRDRWELANMEWWWLNKGRIEYGGTLPEVHEGRLGDAGRLWLVLQTAAGAPPITLNSYDPALTSQNINLFPFPGVWDQDDNRNRFYGGTTNIASGQTFPFMHPLSVTGVGRFTPFGSPKSPDLANVLGGSNPSTWLRYSGIRVGGVPLWSTISGLTPGWRYGHLFEDPGADGDLNTRNDNFLVDDMLEITLEPRSIRRPTDEPFTAADQALLHLSTADIDSTGVWSRLQALMPASIDPRDTSVGARERRHRFATSSWDRKQYSFPRIMGTGPDGAPGQAGVDDDQNGQVDDISELGWPYRRDNSGSTDDLRAWEFNVDRDNDRRYEFPPQFGTVAAYSGIATRKLSTLPQDPIRAELRRLLEVEFGNRDQLRMQFRLSINELLDVIRTGNNGGNPVTSPLEFRPLTPHSTDNAVVSLPTIAPGGDLPPMPPTAWNGSTLEEIREFWARYDRQRMARDIYVLLYTLCGGDDSVNLTSVSGATAYPPDGTPSQLRKQREMAQFAVNLVDAMDRDGVMTVFEYDTNLADGWNLDDQHWTADSSGDREVVIGVEAQELTFSETLWAWQPQYTGGAADNPRTMYPEDTQDYHFLHMELRSVSPRTVNLSVSGASTSTATAIWRISRADSSVGVPRLQTTAGGYAPRDDSIYFKSFGGGTSVSQIGAGQMFTIATSDDYSSGGSSDLYVDYDADGDFDLIAPNVAVPAVGSITGLTPNADLDLTHTAHNTRFELHSGSGASGAFLNATSAPSATDVNLLLERRMNPNLPRLPLSMNPWVTVDRTRAERRDFDLDTTDTTAAMIQAKLPNLTSKEREQPFIVNEPAYPGIDPLTYRSNSLSRNNSNSPAQFNRYQAHFDRDFASIVELFLLPLHGPDQLTRIVNGMRQTPTNQYSGGAVIPQSALAKFMMPQHPTAGATWNNHWHRLLSFTEVPTRTHQQLGGPFATTRVPGRINLNTMRFPEVMAALLDDPEIHGPATPDAPSTPTPGYVPRSLPAIDTPNWWADFLISRDGEHPEYPGTGLTLPGLTGSHPFRDPGVSGVLSGSYNPMQDTIYRDHPDTTTPRGLFDIVTADPVVRKKLLSKLSGNTTTRSNVFLGFISVQFHEAYEDPATGAIRVGGRIDLNNDGQRDDGHRGFFVIDRSAAEEAYDLRTGTFNWKELVKYRVTIN